MAKISFTKLNKIKSMNPITTTIGDQTIEVEQYLPLEKKVDLITAVIEQSGNGEEGFFNIVKLEAYYIIEMIKAYTNISFTEKQLEDTTKLYDAIRLNDVWAGVADAIPEVEQDYIWENILALAREITTYNNSVLGVLKAVSNDRDALNFDVSEIMSQLTDPEAISLLKSMVDKTGLTN